MKRGKIWIGVLLLTVSAVCFLIGRTGGQRFDVCLRDFTQTEDTVTIRVDVISSAGYVRACKPRVNSGGDLTLGFYSTYGLNSRRGAKDTFTLETPEGCDVIFFERSDGAPYIVLSRDPETGLWREWGGG